MHRFGANEDEASSEVVDLVKLAESTGFSVFQLKELHDVFSAQYPGGQLPRATFIAENASSHGGCAALWGRVFDLCMAELTWDVDRHGPLRLVSAGATTHAGTDICDNDDGGIGMSFEQSVTILARNRQLERSSLFERVVRSVFAFFDLKGDGFLDEAELTTVIQWLYELPDTEKLRRSRDVLLKFATHVATFRPSGTITDVTMDELDEAYPSLVRARDRAAQLMRCCDLDQDGKLCETEFMEACRSDQSFVEAFAGR